MCNLKRLVLAALVICLACSTAYAEEIPEAKRTIRISLASSSSEELMQTNTANMMLGDEITFELEQERDDGDFDQVGRGISDKSVIDVSFSDGVFTVKAVKGGTSVITFQNVIRVNPLRLGNAKLLLTFNVAYDPVESLTLDSDQVTLLKGKTKTLTAAVLPATANQSVTWSSSNTGVAKVNDKGKITAVAPGVATVTCVSADENIFAECLVTVTPKVPDPESLTLSEERMHLLKGKTKKLVATVLPANSNKKVTWTTSDKTVAKVTSKGVVKAVAPGTAIITCTTNQAGLTKSCEVVVFGQYATPESLTLNESAITLIKGKTQKLLPAVLPADANQNVTWSTSAKGIAKVSSKGVVTAVKPGTAVITCKTKQGGLIATCDVTVNPKS